MKIAVISSFRDNTKNYIYNSDQNYNKNIYSQNFDSISFQRLLPKNAKIKIAFFDIDETLKHWGDNVPEHVSQNIRNKLFEYIKSHKIKLVYSSDRGLKEIMPLIEDGTLATPDWVVGNNGGVIYKNANGKFEEIKTWTARVAKHFYKDKVRDIMARIANEQGNMFTPEEWAKISPQDIPEGQKEFRGSKFTEYIGHESPINMRFVMAPGMYEQNIIRIKKALKQNGINANTIFLHFPPEMVTYESIAKYFSAENALAVRQHYVPRAFPDGSIDNLIISAADKGTASEYIRELLGLKRNEVFAAGDGENDFGHTNKGYYFALISNASEGLKKMIGKTHKSNIIPTSKPGAEGILEALA